MKKKSKRKNQRECDQCLLASDKRSGIKQNVVARCEEKIRKGKLLLVHGSLR